MEEAWGGDKERKDRFGGGKKFFLRKGKREKRKSQGMGKKK